MRQPESRRPRGSLLRFLYRAFLALILLVLAFRLYLGGDLSETGQGPARAPADSFFRCPCPQVFAHRGASAYRPENTLPAFRLALEMGADILELDVRLSADGQVVVFHDKDLARVTGVKGPLSALKYAELRRLDAAANFRDDRGQHPFRGRGYRIPLLREVLLAFPRTRINLELKDKDARLVQAVFGELTRARAFDRVLVNSASATAMELWAELTARGQPAGTARPIGAATGAVLRAYMAHLLGSDYRPSYHALQLPARPILGLDLTTESFIDFAHWREVRVHYWTVNDPALMRLLVDRGADGIMTDRPDVAVRVLVELGLRPPRGKSRKN